MKWYSLINGVTAALIKMKKSSEEGFVEPEEIVQLTFPDVNVKVFGELPGVALVDPKWKIY